jgi:hypothetical protein
MNLLLTRLEENVLLLHMSIMRNNVKKGFKKRYGSKEGKEHLKTFDGLCAAFKTPGNLEEEQTATNEHAFNQEENGMLYSFISWYEPELNKTMAAAGEKARKEDKEQLQALGEIKNKIEKYIEVLNNDKETQKED